MSARRIIAWIATLVVTLGMAAYAAVWFIEPVQDRVFETAVDRIVQGEPLDLFDDDALRVLICGSSPPVPQRNRAKACIAVIAGGRFYLVDVGPGSWNNLGLWRVPATRIGGVFLTHFHSDHIGELGEVNMQTWIAGRDSALPVYGPSGTRDIVAGFAQAYAADVRLRVEHHGERLLDASSADMTPHEIVFDGAAAEPLRFDDLVVTAFVVDHDPVRPAYGYRFDYGGRSVVVSGDTVKDDNVIRQARGVDVLIHEAQSNEMLAVLSDALARYGDDHNSAIVRDVLRYHTTAVEAAEVARESGASLLVIYHVSPPLVNRLVERRFMRGVADVGANAVRLSQDGDLIELAVGTDEIVYRNLD